MTKIGRNDPCHCGSGKKYKKCCADTDQQRAVAEDQETIMNDLSFSVPSFTDYRNDLPGDDEINERPDENPYPPISSDEEKLVDAWWDVYEKIEPIDEIRSHLDAFMDKHPQLVENLGLEHEVLFELGAEYRRNDRSDEYISFLMNFRNRFPATFARSAGYYDSDIIAWLISKGRSNEIVDYLNYFIENPVKFVDQVYQLIYLLLATDTTDEIVPLITKVAEPIVKSDEIIFGDDIVRPLLINTLSEYIKRDFTQDDVKQFINDLGTVIPYQIVENEHIVDIWTKKLQAITKPFGPWEDHVPKKPEELRGLYSEITLNFIRYLHEKRSISWMSAQYYADLVYDFLTLHLHGEIKMPERLFDFSKKNIEKRVAILTKEMVVYIDSTKFMSLLNGIHLFAGYLHESSMFTTEETKAAQQNCKSSYSEFYPTLKKEYFEALCFGEIPVV